MKGDFTRDTFDASKHFSRVLMQQGRVQLDADWNEQAAILLHYLQALAKDLIGPHGGPAKDDGTAGDGFKITQLLDANNQPVANDFAILRGHYYVDGILCENDSVTAHYADQTDYVLDADAKLKGGTYLVYLDVWERHMTSLEDDYVREKALDGPDTATRTKVVWQVKTTDRKASDGSVLTSKFTAADAITEWPKWIAHWQPPDRGWLQAMVKPLDGGTTDPCITSPQSGFRGAENQLYRVEIHSAGTSGTATFKWSRDNGSVVADWKDKQGNDLIVGSARGFAAGQWVELIDDTRELRGERGTLVKLVKVEGEALTIDPNSTKESTDRQSAFVNPKVRRWDQHATDSIILSDDNAIPVQEGTPLDLEDGIQIQFVSSSPVDSQYRTGDFWLIPARTATGDIEWPSIKGPRDKPIPAPLPPHGVEHHFAPLWIISVSSVSADGTVTAAAGNDLRRKLKPLLIF